MAAEAVRQDAYAFMEKPVNIDKLLYTLDTIKNQQRTNFIHNAGDAHGTDL